MENEKKEIEARYRYNQRIYILLGGVFVLLLVSILFYYNYRQKKKDALKIQIAYEQLKATQGQLVHSEKMASLGELTAGIAHEIQNPLNFVNNFSEVNGELIEEQKAELDKGNFDEAKVIAHEIGENEKKIVHHGKRASDIVKAMLQHSRGTTGQKELTDINALCDEYLRLSYHGLRAKDKNLLPGQMAFNAKYEMDLDPTLPKLNVVSQDIGRVILNLINNAFYAVHERMKNEPESYEPRVMVSTKNLGDKYRDPGKRQRQRYSGFHQRKNLPALLHHQAHGTRNGAGVVVGP